MTLIVVAGTPSYTTLVADRRLSRNGEPVDGGSNKTVFLRCSDGRAVVGFTGFATNGIFRKRPLPMPPEFAPEPNAYAGPPPPGAFRTGWWLADALYQEAPAASFQLDQLIARFRERADSDIPSAVPAAARSLLVVFAGYRDRSGQAELMVCSVSNYGDDPAEPRSRFDLVHDEVSQRGYVMVYGALSAVSPELIRQLRDLAAEGYPPRALIGKSLQVVRDAAGRTEVVGGECTSFVLPSDPVEDPWWDYHADAVTDTIVGPSQVLAVGGDGPHLVTADPFFKAAPSAAGAQPVVTSPKRKRNEPCYCGSGKKYKRCHGA